MNGFLAIPYMRDLITDIQSAGRNFKLIKITSQDIPDAFITQDNCIFILKCYTFFLSVGIEPELGQMAFRELFALKTGEKEVRSGPVRD